MKPLVIWDWNGTLLDDIDVCVAAMNKLLERRGLSVLQVDEYRSVFSFPVQAYYEAVGFDFAKESFDKVAVEYHDEYEAVVDLAPLHSSAIEALELLKANGATQVVLSALEEGRLRRELRKRGIDHYFDHAFGLGDLHAISKVERGRELLAAVGPTDQTPWMIGDTDHDAEVASGIGVECLLVTCGHHSEERLQSTGGRLVKNPVEASRLILSIE